MERKGSQKGDSGRHGRRAAVEDETNRHTGNGNGAVEISIEKNAQLQLCVYIPDGLILLFHFCFS